VCTYNLINKNLSKKTSNKKKNKISLYFIMGWVSSQTEEIKYEEEYVEKLEQCEEFMGSRNTMEVLKG
jgi:hypothetical protein